MMKRCTKCGTTKPISDFTRDSHTKDGFRVWCKQCQKISRAGYWKNYYREHKERAKEYARNHRKPHGSHRPNYWKEYHAKNKDKRTQYQSGYWKKYYQANKEKAKEYAKGHRKLDKVKERIRKNAPIYKHKRRARLAGNGGSHTVEDIERQLLVQKYKCWWCGHDISSKYTTDHLIPISKGGTDNPDNIVMACLECNCSKHDKMPWEWIGRLF